MSDKIEFHMWCHGDCSKIIDTDDGPSKQLEVTVTFYEYEKRPKICPKCGTDQVSYGIHSINGKGGLMPTSEIVKAYRPMVAAAFAEYDRNKKDKANDQNIKED